MMSPYGPRTGRGCLFRHRCSYGRKNRLQPLSGRVRYFCPKVDQRAVKIEGRTDYPINPGGICPVGIGGLQLLYDNDMRFPGPMKRVGARGEGEFVNITWGEAYDILAGRIANLRKAGKPEAIAAVDGNVAGTTTSVLIERFMQAVGSPNYVKPGSITDTYNVGNLLMQGNQAPWPTIWRTPIMY